MENLFGNLKARPRPSVKKTLPELFHSVLEQIWVKGSYLSQWLP